MAQNASLFSELNLGQRAALVFGVLGVLGVSLAGYLWLNRVDYQPIYRDLNQADAAKVIAELKERKVPYELADGGSTVLVDSSQAEELKVTMADSKLSIGGGEGFELFDDIDYGMTEFAQKINYQRALQGEISRTLVGLKEIRYARVHLVLPEKALFQAAREAPKASITLLQEPGEQLSADQVRGIQELVASAVEGMEPGNVTLLDEAGMVLSRSRFDDDEGMGSRLEQKQDMERYLGVKTARILDQVFGPGKAVVNIDVSLSYDQVQVTRESYQPAEKNPEAGLLERSRVQRQYKDREREGGTGNSKNPLYSETTEYDYRIGKSVEQVVKSTGAVERLTVSVMVPDSTGEDTLAALRELVANAVGLRPERGDDIRIFALPMAEFKQLQLPAESVPGEGERPAPAAPAASGPQPGATDGDGSAPDPLLFGIGILLLLGLASLPFVLGGRAASGARLSAEERNALLAEVRAWLDEDAAQRPAGEQA